jgi:predicted enzyme related to lactoylglutathione lyase
MASETITGVDFVTVPTEDLEASAAFYGDVLGLRNSVMLAERGYAEFETGNLTLSVVVPEKMGMKPWVSASVIALHVDDMDAARERLTQAGVSFAGDPFDTGVCGAATGRRRG